MWERLNNWAYDNIALIYKWSFTSINAVSEATMGWQWSKGITLFSGKKERTKQGNKYQSFFAIT